MRVHRRFLTSVAVCTTLFFVVFRSRPTVDLANDPKTYTTEQRSTEQRRIDKGQTYRYVTPSLAELGSRRSVPKMNTDILMLTRVPNAGAELLVLILQRLQGYNAFKHVRLPHGDHRSLSSLQQELLVEEITNIARQEAIPLSFDGDVGYLNFSKFGRQPPSFIALVRNPLHVRNSRRYRERRKDSGLESRAIPIFCGQDPRCAILNDKWALQRAKANVIEWYPVVGILDCMEQSINVLEQKFPYFFRGAGRMYKKIRPKKKYVSDASYALDPPGGDRLAKLFEDELELYRWLKFRLFNATLKSVTGT